jgi:LacI family transcriptional regulator
MVRGVEAEATKAGLTLLLANSAENAAAEARSIRALTERQVDGLIVAPVSGSRRQELRTVITRGTPVVVMDRIGSLKVDQVGVQNAQPMTQLVLHLAAHGHTRIALAAGDTAVSTIAERYAGYVTGMARAQLSVRPSHVITGSGLAEETREAARRLLRGARRPTAVIAVSTETAVGVLSGAKDLGLATPQDFAFATFDGFPYADLFRPHLTTVTQPAVEIGATAMRLLLRRLAPGADHKPETIRLVPHITFRESCGCVDTGEG